MKRLILLIITASLISGCASTAQHTSTERELSKQLDICLRKSAQQRMQILESSLNTLVYATQMEQCMEGGQELAYRLNSCIDTLLSANCNSRAFEDVSQ